jgi:hypothetical protein
MNRLLNRRTVLRGAGVALALPWLESLAPKLARGATNNFPKRFLPIFFPNGSATFWRPANPGVGNAWALSPILQPFQALKSKMTVLTNVENYTPADPTTSTLQPSHGRDPGVFLSCVDAPHVRDVLKSKDANGITADQVIAQHPNYATQTALQSLQVGLSTIESYCDGQPCSLSRSISWKSPTEPMYKEIDPLKVFNAIVGAAPPAPGGTTMPDPERERQRKIDGSVLDAVIENATRTQKLLGKSDQARLDQFLTSVRETEKTATVVSGGMTKAGTSCNTIDAPTLKAAYGMANGGGYNKGAHMDVMNDLIVMGLACDATRVVSYMLEDERSEFVYDHVPQRAFSATGSTTGSGSCGNYHGAQHGGDANNNFATINWWQSTKIADLLTKMNAITEGEGTLLDNSIVMYASCMHGGNHAANDLPVALFGSGGGTFKTDQNVQFDAELPLRDLYFTIMNSYFELGVSSFGVSTRNVPNQLIKQILV